MALRDIIMKMESWQEKQTLKPEFQFLKNVGMKIIEIKCENYHIKKLYNYREKGLLTEEEFNEQKKKLLNNRLTMTKKIIFGEIDGIKEGDTFIGRKEMMPLAFIVLGEEELTVMEKKGLQQLFCQVDIKMIMI